MKIVFFGTTRFSAHILESLIQNKDLCTVCAVVTRPDRPAGRSLKLKESEVKQFLKAHPNIPLYQPEKVSTQEFETILKSLHVDIFIVVAFGEIIKQNILDLPSLGCFNIHASLLPKYRGAAPIQRAIMEGESETGITIIKMVLKMDAGPIVFTMPVPINHEDQFVDIERKLMDAGSKSIFATLEMLSEGKIVERFQDESLVTFANKIEPRDCIIHWKGSAKKIVDQIRALSPSPGAYSLAHIRGEQKRVKILVASPSSQSLAITTMHEPGDLRKIEGDWCIAAEDGWVIVDRLQMEGKPQMSSKDFFNGFKVDRFEEIDL